MVIYLIGLGLNFEWDITICGLETIEKCNQVYLKQSLLYSLDIKHLENICNCELKLVDKYDELLNIFNLLTDTAILCPGDPFEIQDNFFAKIRLEAHRHDVSIQVIHNASIINGIGSSGLQLYRLGQVVSLNGDNWTECSKVVALNTNKNLHSLVTVQERSSKDGSYEGVDYFNSAGLSLMQNQCPNLKAESTVVFASALGQPNQRLKMLMFEDLSHEEPHGFPCCFVICSQLHPMELEAIQQLANFFEKLSISNASPSVNLTNALKSALNETETGTTLSNFVMHPESITNTTKDNASPSINHSNGAPNPTETVNTLSNSVMHPESISNTKNCTFHLIGLGLGRPEDISISGKMAIEESSRVFLECYTSVMLGGKEGLEKYFGKSITVADRDMVEQDSDEILPTVKSGNISLLIVGDPLGATTHTDLLLRAIDNGYTLNIIHNASIMNAAAVCGLNPNNFGETVSIPFWDDTWKPESFYDKICSNLENGWHTLCLLDIKVKEQSIENLLKGRKIYEPARFMTTAQACSQLQTIADNRPSNNSDSISNSRGSTTNSSSEVNKTNRDSTSNSRPINEDDNTNSNLTSNINNEGDNTNKDSTSNSNNEHNNTNRGSTSNSNNEGETSNRDSTTNSNDEDNTTNNQSCLLKSSTKVVGLARVGTDSEKLISCSLEEMVDFDLGGPLHSLIVIGKMNDIETKVVELLSSKR